MSPARRDEAWIFYLTRESSKEDTHKKKKEEEKWQKEAPAPKWVSVFKGSPLHMIAPFTLLTYGLCGTSPIRQSCAWKGGFKRALQSTRWAFQPKSPMWVFCVSKNITQILILNRYIQPKVLWVYLMNLVMEILVISHWTEDILGGCVGSTCAHYGLVYLLWSSTCGSGVHWAVIRKH